MNNIWRYFFINAYVPKMFHMPCKPIIRDKIPDISTSYFNPYKVEFFVFLSTNHNTKMFLHLVDLVLYLKSIPCIPISILPQKLIFHILTTAYYMLSISGKYQFNFLSVSINPNLKNIEYK